MSANEYIDQEKLESLKPKEATTEKPPKKRKGPSAFTQILNGDFLTREFVLNNLSFIFFIMFLLLLLVGKGYYGKELSQDINKTQKELDEMTADYVEAKAKLEEETRRYRLVEKLEPKGLKETTNQTKVIRLKEKKDE
jgi:cell division protein FtsL